MLWPNSAADRPDTAFHTTISRLRKRLRDATGTDTTDDVITTSDGRWHLNRDQVTVDYWTFLEAHPRNPTPPCAAAIITSPSASTTAPRSFQDHVWLR